MKVIDCNTGAEIVAGKPWHNVNGEKMCRRITEGVFNVQVEYVRLDSGRVDVLTIPIRFFHPKFMFQRVAIFPS